MEDVTKDIGGTQYVLRLFPTMTGLTIVNRLEREGFSPEVVFEVVSKGASIGSIAIDRKKFDTHFRGKYAELMELFGEILLHNKMFPEAKAEEGNELDSEE